MKKQTLSELTTVEEVLDHVAAFDRAAHDFYSDLLLKVSKKIRYIVEELAHAELTHIRMLQDLRENPEVIAHIHDAMTRPQADHRFSDAIHTPDLGEHPDDQAVLQYALAREQLAIEEYSELAELTPPGPLHDVFQFLANEERKHKAETEKLYYEIIHSGGV